MQHVDRDLDRKIAEARPVVPLGFADDVLRALVLVPAVMPSPRRWMHVGVGAVFAAALVIALVVVGRERPDKRGELESHRVEPAVAPIVLPLPRPSDHTIDPKLQRCTACHSGVPAPAKAGAVAVVAYLDLESPSARESVRVLEWLAIELRGDVAIDVALVPRSQKLSSFAALSAAQQGKLWPMLELIVQRADHGRDALVQHAIDLALDAPRFEHTMSDHLVLDAIRDALTTSDRLGITTGFVVGGRTFRSAEVAAMKQHVLGLARRSP